MASNNPAHAEEDLVAAQLLPDLPDPAIKVCVQPSKLYNACSDCNSVTEHAKVSKHENSSSSTAVLEVGQELCAVWGQCTGTAACWLIISVSINMPRVGTLRSNGADHCKPQPAGDHENRHSHVHSLTAISL